MTLGEEAETIEEAELIEMEAGGPTTTTTTTAVPKMHRGDK